MLLERGADVNSRNSDGLTPADLATDPEAKAELMKWTDGSSEVKGDYNGAEDYGQSDDDEEGDSETS